MARKRVEDEDAASGNAASTMMRAKNGSAFARCDQCNKDVAVALISFHDCGLDEKIKKSLESQVADKVAEAKKPAERKRALPSEGKGKKAKKEKKAKNPNAPKRPTTAFFLFMDDFRKSYKEANPDSKDVKKIAKEGGEKWKALTDEEKKQYVDKAAELKAEYEKALKSDKAGNEEDEAGSGKEETGEEKEEEAEQVEEASEEE